MPHLYNSEDLKERRRSLRRSQTEAERKLWGVLRGKRMNGVKFFRQYGIGAYILDFYCPAFRLAIEVDGSQHIDSDSDAVRTAYLREQNIMVIRFWNNDVLRNLEGVYEKVREAIADLTPPNLPL
ncbi:MAG: endonuclease domain-containing protein [bacterium]|nr:endonuclease domain-containing protein [bacterium]